MKNSQQIFTIYSWAALAFAMTATRDYTLHHQIQEKQILGEIIVVNIISSALTEYISNNKSWASKRFIMLLTAGAILSLILNKQFAGAIFTAYILGSFGFAFASGKKIIAGKFSFPLKATCVELGLQTATSLAFGHITLEAATAIRLSMSLIMLLSIDEQPVSSKILHSKTNNYAYIGQFFSTAALLALAAANELFFNSNPSTKEVIAIRIASYIASIAMIPANAATNLIIKNERFKRILPERFIISGSTISIVSGTLVAISSFEAMEFPNKTHIALIIIATTPISLICFRIASRLKEDHENQI